MAFPVSPSNGQIYGGKYYDSSINSWRDEKFYRVKKDNLVVYNTSGSACELNCLGTNVVNGAAGGYLFNYGGRTKDYVRIPNDAQNQLSSLPGATWSMNVYVYNFQKLAGVTSDELYLFCKENSYEAGIIFDGVANPRKLWVAIMTPSGSWNSIIFEAYTFEPNIKYHISIVFYSGMIYLWVDGQFIQSKPNNHSGVIKASTEDLVLGYRFAYPMGYSAGHSISDFRIYNVAITDREVVSLYKESCNEVYAK